MDGDMVLGGLVMFFIAASLLMYWLYVHGRWRQMRLAEDARIDQLQQQQIEMKAAQRKGLDRAVIEALPIFIYKSNEENGSVEGSAAAAAAGAGAAACRKAQLQVECPVCLCEFEHNERGRVLPNCQHRFHVDCIDMWLLSNATCPVCRASCAGGDADGADEVALQVILDHASNNNNMGVQYPTNVLFWGSNSRVSSRVSLDGPPPSNIIQVFTQDPLDASAPSSSSIPSLNPLRRLLERRHSGPPFGSHSHDSPSTHISILKA